MPQTKTLIVGAGYIGEAFADFAHAKGPEVVACTASEDSAKALAGVKPYPVAAADVSRLGEVERLRADHGAFDLVLFSASSGRGGAERYRSVYFEGAQNIAATFKEARLIFTGSTSVYAQIDGGWVDESSPAEPDRETGKWLRQAEDVVLGSGGSVARLAGIYGPGRSVLLRKFLAGRAVIEGDGEKWLNQAHRDDIVNALWTIWASPATASSIYNVCDNQPLTQRECYAGLARHFDRLLPPSAPPDYDRKRGWTNKRVANARLRALGWEPRYPSFLRSIEAGLDPGLEGAEGTPANSA